MPWRKWKEEISAKKPAEVPIETVNLILYFDYL